MNLEEFAKDLPYLDLPSTMWGIHIHPQMEYISIIHINICNANKLIIDKGILLSQEEYVFRANILLNGSVSHVPNIVLNVRSVTELSALVDVLHGKVVCKNDSDVDGYPNCLKLIDKQMVTISPYCTACQEKNILTELTQTIQESQRFEVCGEVDSLPINIENQFIKDVEESVGFNSCAPEIYTVTDKKNYNYNKHKVVDDMKNEVSNTKPNKDRQVLCSFCGKMFANNHQIKEHMLIHTHEKPFQCKICSKSFSRSFNLRIHENTHSGDRPYVCSICGKSYTASSNLRTHILSGHNNEKKYVCQICKMTFVYPRYLRIHMRKHTREKPFMCSTCGKNFAKNIHLTIHIRTHTGEKPHRCDTCGKGFTTTGGLGYHKRAHHKHGT